MCIRFTNQLIINIFNNYHAPTVPKLHGKLSPEVWMRNSDKSNIPGGWHVWPLYWNVARESAADSWKFGSLSRGKTAKMAVKSTFSRGKCLIFVAKRYTFPHQAESPSDRTVTDNEITGKPETGQTDWTYLQRLTILQMAPVAGGSRDEEYDTDRASDACGSDNEAERKRFKEEDA